MILSQLLPDVLGRAEENLPTATYLPGPTFWDLAGEVYPQMVDGMFEAALITGVVQLSNVTVTLAADTTFFSLQNNVSIGIPKGVIGAIRLKAPYPIRKTTLKKMDDMIPAWQQAAPGTQLISWFPLGVSMFGIYPQLNAEATVTMDFIYSPCNEYRPYTGNETLPFQTEFTDFIAQYGATMLRMKEGGAEAEEAETVYKEYLGNMRQLSAFQTRLDSLVFSGAFGVRSKVSARTAV